MSEKSTETCQSLRLTLLHYNELPAQEKNLAEKHLEHCRDCRLALEKMQQTLGALPSLNTSVTEHDARRLSARVMDRVDQTSKKTSKIKVAHPLAWGSALAAAAALLLLVWIQPGNTPSPSPQGQNQSAATLAQTPEVEFLEDMELLEDFEMLMLLAQGQG